MPYRLLWNLLNVAGVEFSLMLHTDYLLPQAVQHHLLSIASPSFTLVYVLNLHVKEGKCVHEMSTLQRAVAFPSSSCQASQTHLLQRIARHCTKIHAVLKIIVKHHEVKTVVHFGPHCQCGNPLLARASFPGSAGLCSMPEKEV